MGNPTSYDGWTYEWQAGRRLKRMTKNGSAIDYRYDMNGLRTQKIADGDFINYFYSDDGRLIAQSDGVNNIYFRYDSDGNLFGFNENGKDYLYVRNMQGDVVAITNIYGAVLAEYTYDAWGKVIDMAGPMAGTIGERNPIRYRGYYYDQETGYYYLQSRYYDPE